MKNGFYRYDPTNYHGHSLLLLFLAQALFGRHIWVLRCRWCCEHRLDFFTLKFEPFVAARERSRRWRGGFARLHFLRRYSIHEVWLLLFSTLFVLGLLGCGDSVPVATSGAAASGPPG